MATDEHTPAAGRAPSARRELRAIGELFAMCGFAITLPLLDLFGRSPEQFLFRGADRTDVVVWALVVTVAPALVLWALEAVVGLVVPASRTVVHLALIGGLAATFAVQALRPVVGGVALFVLAGLAGVGAAALRQRFAATQTWLGFAALAPLAFLGLFLLGSGTARLLSTDEPRAVAAGVGNPAPVVMLVFDEFPLTSLVDSDGSIDAELYPNVAALADDSHWFRNTTAVSSSTWHAVPSITTGRYPEDGTAPIAVDHPDTLFTLLGDAYEMNVTESVTRLCPASICRSPEGGGLRALLRDAADVMRARLSLDGPGSDPVAALVEETADPGDQESQDGGFADFGLDQPARFRTLIDGIDRDPASLHYLHILLPHVPYRYLPDGVQYDSPDPDLGRIEDDWADEAWLAHLGRQRLQLQVAYVDALVGQLVTKLRDDGVYDDALIVLTADHGISFEPGGPIRGIEGQPLDDPTLAQLAWIPFLLKEPGQQDGKVSDANVESVDVLPTIADVLDVELVGDVDGRSALGVPRDRNTKTFFPSDVHAFAVEALDPIEIDGTALWRSVLDRATDTVLPAVGSPARFWQAGPHSELVGTRVADAGPGTLERVDARLDGAGAFEAFDQSSGRAPALVRGELAVQGEVAVAVNGVVAATAPTYRDGERIRFAAMVDATRFRSGANEMTVHLIA